jgi:hypothetical protein
MDQSLIFASDEEFYETVLSTLQRDIHNLAKGFFNLILNLKGFIGEGVKVRIRIQMLFVLFSQ